MNIKFRTRNFTLTEEMKEKIDKKITSIWGMFHEDTIFDIYIVQREKDYKCEIKVQRGKDFIRSEEIGKTVEYSVSNAINTLKKRVRKVKSMKITKKYGNSTLSLKNNKNIDVEDFEEDNKVEDLKIEEKIERRKFIALDKMTEEEAILYLESLNHSFFLFKNRDLDNKVCVVYRRDIGYGLIETE